METLLRQQQQDSQHQAEEMPLEDYEATMKLNLLEIQLALVIKEAVEASPSLTNLTDFEYVQYALTHPTNNEPSEGYPLSTLMEHIGRMEAFRKEYRIQDTADEGAELMHQLSLDQPGLFLSVQYLPSSGSCIAVNDLKDLHPDKIKTREQYRAFMGASYYRFQCMSPHFNAIRQGMSSLFECEGVSFKNFNWRFHEQLINELYVSYPKRHKEMFFVNSPMVLNTAYGLWKPYMTQNMKESFHLGYQINGFEGHRLDELFQVPSEEVARQHMVEQVHRLLLVRYHNQSQFTIPRHVTAAALWQHLHQPVQVQPLPPTAEDDAPDHGERS